MKESVPKQPGLIGRDAELSKLRHALADAVSGKGSTVFIAGEAGVGKTRLTEAFRSAAVAENVTILSGAADASSARPFLVLSKALEQVIDRPLFEEQEHTWFMKIFAINQAGMLMAQATSGEEDMDADIFAGMLSAIQNFVSDSLGRDSGDGAGLGRLEYGEMKILIEHGRHLFLTGVFSGGEHPDMKNSLRRTLQRIEEEHGGVIGAWSGKVSEAEPIRLEVSRLIEAKFLVRKDLDTLKLENERIRISDEALEALKRCSEERPVAAFLEDLHWADESSLFVLNYLARNIGRSRILLMGTLRPGESDALQKAIDSMREEGIFDFITLEKLNVDEIASLIGKACSPNDFPRTLVEKLYEQSKGNPLFVVEMLKGMQRDGNIAMRDGRYTLASESFSVPATVEEVVNRRLDSLDPDSMAMAEYASCIGQRFDSSLAVSNRMIKDADASLEKLLASGILQRMDGSLEFSHAVFRSVIYSGIGERWKAGHHRSLGEHLEMVYADRLDEVIYDLARHFTMAKDHRRTSDYCTRAGERAEGSFAMQQALAFYRDALAALSGNDAPEAMERAMSITERVGNIRKLVGDYDSAIADFLRVKEMASDNEAKARMLRNIGDVHEKKGEYDRAIEVLDEAKGLVEAGSNEHGRIMYVEGNAYYRKGDYDRALESIRAAINVAENAGSGKKDMGNALRAIGIIHWYKGEYDSAIEYYERSMAIMEEAGERYGIAASLNNIGLVHWAKGELDRALEFYGRSLEMDEKIGDKPGIANALNNIGNVHNDRGELSMALEFYLRSLEIDRKIGNKQGVAMSLYNIGSVHHNRGDLDKALDFYVESLGIQMRIGELQGIAYSRIYMGSVHIDRGEPGKALEHLEASLAMCDEIGDRRLSLYALNGLAEAKLMAGKALEALDYAEKAVRNSADMGAMMEEGVSRRVLGMVRREMGDWEGAAIKLGEAEGILLEVGDKMELARWSFEKGLLLKSMNEPDKARECFGNALSEFQRMGMALWAGKCRNAMAEP